MIAISALSRGRAGRGVARRVDVHILGERLERRLRALVREVPRILDDCAHLAVDGGHLLVGPLAALLHLRAEHRDRIALHVFVELLLAAIGAAHRIGPVSYTHLTLPTNREV